MERADQDACLHMTDDQREAYEERAGILQFEAGMTREEAERVAMMQVTKAIGRKSRLCHRSPLNLLWDSHLPISGRNRKSSPQFLECHRPRSISIATQIEHLGALSSAAVNDLVGTISQHRLTE